MACCNCIKLCVCSMCVCMYVAAVAQRQMAQVPSTPMSLRLSPRVCSAAGVFLPACVCRAVCSSLQRPGRMLRPLMLQQRAREPARQRGNGHRQHTAQTRAGTLWFILFFFFLWIQGYCWRDSPSDSLLLLLPNQRCFNLPWKCIVWLYVAVSENYARSQLIMWCNCVLFLISQRQCYDHIMHWGVNTLEKEPFVFSVWKVFHVADIMVCSRSKKWLLFCRGATLTVSFSAHRTQSCGPLCPLG